MVGAPLKTPNPTPPQPPQKPRPATSQRDASGSSKRGGRPALMVRVLLTIFVVWHVSAVFLAALSVPGPTSNLVMNIAQRKPMQWYLDALYLNQGHSFFAPNVGPGHLIRYQLYDQNGQVMKQGEFPNREVHWPRLLYHRYFMLADQSEIPDDNKAIRDAWQRKFLEAYGRELLRENDNAQSVRLQRYAHWPPPLKAFEDAAGPDGKNPVDGKLLLTDPKRYELLLEVTQRRSDLQPPPTNQSMYWQQSNPNSYYPQSNPNSYYPQSNPNMYYQQANPEMARRWSGGTR